MVYTIYYDILVYTSILYSIYISSYIYDIYYSIILTLCASEVNFNYTHATPLGLRFLKFVIIHNFNSFQQLTKREIKTMSVRDICELGALLNAEDSDRENLECELTRLTGELQTAKMRLNQERANFNAKLCEGSKQVERSTHLDDELSLYICKKEHLITKTDGDTRVVEELKRSVEFHVDLVKAFVAEMDEVDAQVCALAERTQTYRADETRDTRNSRLKLTATQLEQCVSSIAMKQVHKLQFNTCSPSFCLAN